MWSRDEIGISGQLNRDSEHEATDVRLPDIS